MEATAVFRCLSRFYRAGRKNAFDDLKMRLLQQSHFLDLFPGALIEEDQNREDLQASQKPGEGQQDLGEAAEAYVAGIGTHGFECGTYIGNAGQGGGEIAEEAVFYLVGAGIRHNGHCLPVYRVEGEIGRAHV